MTQPLDPATVTKLEQIRSEIVPLLNQMNRAMPHHYHITLVARHTEIPQAQLVFTEEKSAEDLALACEAIMTADIKV